MELGEIIGAFAAEFGIEGVAVDGDGAYNFDIDGIDVMITTVGNGTRLGMFAEIGEHAFSDREVLYRTLLRSMAPGEKSEGMSFSILPDPDRIVVSRDDSLDDTDYAAFKERLGKLVNTAREWRQSVADFSPLCEEAAKAAKNSDEAFLNLRQSGFLRV